MSAKYFREFRENIAVKNYEDIGTSYDEITKRLNRTFWGIDSADKNRLRVGSYGRHTAINGISDLDMLFEIPEAIFKKYSAYEYNGQSALLQAVKNALLERYPNTDISGDGQVVCVKFKRFHVEVLPAYFDPVKKCYLHPNTHDGGSWRPTYPREEIDAMKALNTKANRNLGHLCKMVRAWKNHRGVGMSGWLVDTLCYNFFVEHPKFHTATYDNYPGLVAEFFLYLTALSPNQQYWLAPGSRARVPNDGSFLPKAKKAAKKATDALAEGDLKKRVELWRDIFGGCFPPAVQMVKATAQVATESFGGARSTEEFIENQYPLDIRYRLAIDCEVSTTGTILRLSRIFEHLRWGWQLKFQITEHNVPKPYSVFWKVRNKPLAGYRQDIRGQLLEDQGSEERQERTSFAGDHYVECYIVKDEVCVARDRIKVPIGTM
ncbi:hypothetical protein LMG23992_04042 [Cupriavidus laharis]|uniref:Adenylyl/Guanylyl and SMODS C-terminal sensor domain-containing protein n=1 Tax=Cupriavidus laharis TaxID=151654 RepID=A0ABN7Z5N2_9BURK|nr:nucleotidyltransferase [Cupriavidus laharis]CAG9179681.1 hypothetical protein LMG23992_04042 [Cupriavidus laharis]